MKKTLLLGTALVVGVAGFAQSTAKKAVNPKHLQKTSVFAKNRILAKPTPTATKGKKATFKKNHQSTSSACTTGMSITTSWNCFGVGGGSTTSAQNCLSYNEDLNSLVWIQRGSAMWGLNTTSGSIQATIINPTTLALDSVVLYHDANTTHHARYPGGVLLNPAGNTDIHKAFAVGFGQVIDNGTTWQGTAYTPKPLWSKSAVNHTAPTGDSIFAPSPNSGGIFGMCANGTISSAPALDAVAMPDHKTVRSIGMIGDPSITCTNCVPFRGAVIAKTVLDPSGTSFSVSADTILPPVRTGALGNSMSEARMAWGKDGLHGYVVFLGRLATNYGNRSADSAFTPIVYATTDGGTTW